MRLASYQMLPVPYQMTNESEKTDAAISHLTLASWLAAIVRPYKTIHADAREVRHGLMVGRRLCNDHRVGDILAWS